MYYLRLSGGKRNSLCETSEKGLTAGPSGNPQNGEETSKLSLGLIRTKGSPGDWMQWTPRHMGREYGMDKKPNGSPLIAQGEWETS